MEVQITIRDVDKEVFKEFKAEAVQRGLTLGVAMTLAMEKFRSSLPKKKFTKLQPADWGLGTEHLSDNVDLVLYGE